jgi:hypothetical protein
MDLNKQQKRDLAIFGAGVLVVMFMRRKRGQDGPSVDTNIPVNTSGLRYDVAAYQNAADISYNAMRGAGTSSRDVFKAVEDLNPDELRMVFKLFGERRRPWPSKEKLTLIGWYYNDLGWWDLGRMKQIWKDTGLWPN